MDVTDGVSDISRVFVELASELRLLILLKLNREKLRQSDLAKAFDATPQEAHRNIDRLIETGLVVKNPEGLISLTTFGKAVLEQIPDFAFLAEHNEYFEEHTLGNLPIKFIRCIGAPS